MPLTSATGGVLARIALQEAPAIWSSFTAPHCQRRSWSAPAFVPIRRAGLSLKWLARSLILLCLIVFTRTVPVPVAIVYASTVPPLSLTVPVLPFSAIRSVPRALQVTDVMLASFQAPHFLPVTVETVDQEATPHRSTHSVYAVTQRAAPSVLRLASRSPHSAVLRQPRPVDVGILWGAAGRRSRAARYENSAPYEDERVPRVFEQAARYDPFVVRSDPFHR